MNARQKAKKFKKELENIKNMPMPICKVYQGNVKRYRARQTVENDYLNTLAMSTEAENPYRYILNSITRELVEKIINDVEFETEPSYIPGHMDITGEIAIVTRKEARNKHD